MCKATVMSMVLAVALTASGGVTLAQPVDTPTTPQSIPEQIQQPGESAASEARIRAMLEKQGYGDVQNIQKQDDAYVATATKEGERVQVRIDPQLGQIEEHSR